MVTLHDCPDFYVDNEGRFTNQYGDGVNKHKVYPSVEAFMKLRKRIKKAWKTGFKVMKKENVFLKELQ